MQFFYHNISYGIMHFGSTLRVYPLVFYPYRTFIIVHFIVQFAQNSDYRYLRYVRKYVRTLRRMNNFASSWNQISLSLLLIMVCPYVRTFFKNFETDTSNNWIDYLVRYSTY